MIETFRNWNEFTLSSGDLSSKITLLGGKG
jgi:hypothetical protein